MMPNQNNTTTWATMDANTTQSSNHTTTRNQARTTKSYNLESTKMNICHFVSKKSNKEISNLKH